MKPRGVLPALGNKISVFLLLRMRVWVKGYVIDRRLARDAENVENVQRNLLLRILRFHRNTEYGLLHGFAGIQNETEFRKRIPVNTYEDLRPWFEKQEREQTYAINAEHPTLYTLTSGTTGKPKLIPVLRSTLKNNRHIQNFFLNYLFRARSRVADGKIFTIASPAIEGYTEYSKTPFGATTGHMYAAAPKLVQNKYVIPPAVFNIKDYDLRFHMILRLAIQCPEITYMTAANPTTFTRLITLLNEKWDELIEEMETGAFPRMELLSEVQRKIVRQRLKADPQRAEELRQIRGATRDGRIRLRDVWKDIQAAGMWTGGSCAIFYERLKDEFSPQTLIRDVGYHSSEFRGSSPIFADSSAGIPTFREHYLEFSPRDSWDSGEQVFLGLHQLDEGKEYYIFVTTDSGLYRYDMNDVVRVEGFYRRLPLLRFMQKGKGVTSITGEKLYENQVIQAVRAIEAELPLKSAFYMMVADEQNAQYTLYYEPTHECTDRLREQLPIFTSKLDSALGTTNIEFAAKRDSRRLAPPKVVPLVSGAYEIYKYHCIDSGQRESQFKIIALYYKKDLNFDFTVYALSSSEESIRKPTRKNLKQTEAAQVS